MSDDPSRNGADQGQEAQPRGPGQRLRDQREALGLPLAHVAQEMRILRSVLEALEEDRYEVLEAPIFVRGHLKNYARLLNLPPEEIVEAYERTLPAQQAPELRIDTERGPAMNAGPPRWVFSVAWLLLLTMLVLGGLWWYAGPHREPLAALNGTEEHEPRPSMDGVERNDVTPDTDADTGERSPASLTDDSDPEGLDVLQPLEIVEQDDDGTAAVAGDRDRETEPVPSVDPARETAGEDRHAQPAATLVDDVDPAERRELTVSLEEDSWLEVHDSDDRQLYYGLAVEGDRLNLSGRAPITVFMGNAPAVEVLVDGEALDFSGRVRRDNTARITIAPRSD
jgi:cytoskeleton protein RodZ